MKILPPVASKNLVARRKKSLNNLKTKKSRLLNRKRNITKKKATVDNFKKGFI